MHVWDPAANVYDWLEGVLDRAYLPEEYHAAASGTTGVIFVQAGALDGLAEARWVASLPWPRLPWSLLRGIVAQAPLERGDAVAGYLDEARDIPGVVGIRRLLQDEPLAFFEDPGLVAGLRALAATGLPFDACIRHHQLPALTALLAQLPGLRVVLDHLGKPPVAAGDDGTWARNLRALAELPQVSVKLSGLPPESDGDAPALAQASPWLEVALEAFGAERCMVGSDWPVSAVTPHALGPAQWLSGVLDDLGASGSEREHLAWRSAAAFYGVDAVG